MELILETIVTGIFQENTFLLGCPQSKRAVVIDPGDQADRLIALLDNQELQLEAILLTHGHIDHIGAVADLQERFKAAVYLHRSDEFLASTAAEQARLFDLPVPRSFSVDHWIAQGDIVRVGEIELQVIETPGHTPGSVCYYCPAQGILFSGDTLFWGSVGRTDLPGGNTDALLCSIRERLLTLPLQTAIYAGHGPVSTVAHEKESNPFLNDRVF
ncbi:MBL fold metallo-hydrolase [candidate division KSB1 bacterium]|nr:MBL fold metallo-hydrolase [candidate division KSB1 bacterium]